MPFDLHGLPGEPIVVRNTDRNTNFLLYAIPGTKPPVYLAWRITNVELEAAFGEGREVEYDYEWTDADMRAHGILEWGFRAEINNDTGDPAAAWLETMESQRQVRPWLNDPEVLAIHWEAYIEGRAVTEAEMQTTQWWRTHNDDQRKWMLLTESDPRTADIPECTPYCLAS